MVQIQSIYNLYSMYLHYNFPLHFSQKIEFSPKKDQNIAICNLHDIMLRQRNIIVFCV